MSSKFLLDIVFFMLYLVHMAKLTTTEFAKQVGLTRARIIQMLLAGDLEGEKFGSNWAIEDSLVQVVKDRPEVRGKSKKKGGARRPVKV